MLANSEKTSPSSEHSCPGLDVVTINQLARELQSVLAEAHVKGDQLERTEALCLKIHRSACAILHWVDKQKNYP
jgi:hypothetical protein